MELPARIRQLVDWPGWRRYGPSAGSVAAHVVVGLVVASLLTASGKALPPVRAAPPQPALQLVLLADEPSPPLGVRAPEPRRPVVPPEPPTRAPEAPPVDLPRKNQQAGKQPTVADKPSASDGAVFLPPPPVSNYNGPAGLRAAVESDPCKPGPDGWKPADRRCTGVNWAGQLNLGVEDTLMPRSKNQVATYFPEFAPTCPYRVGCEGGEWRSNNGTRSAAGTAMAVGSAGGGGISSLAGRLIPNPDHIDPGFGD